MTLSAQSLTKRYGAAPGHAAVRGASLDVGRGEFISIVGRSGSGKSTLMAMLGALTEPTAGRVLLDGTDVWMLPETERATFRACHVGFVFQFPSLLSNLTAVDNVAVPALLGRTMPAEEAYARAHELLARVGLADRADAYPDGMSGGEQRRVAVARALINAPPLLLADEPTSDLDEDTETDIIDLLEGLQRRDAFGLVLVTHDLRLAARAQRSFEMRQGTLAARELPRLEAAPHRSVAGASVAAPPVGPPRAPVRLGESFWRGVRIFLPAAAAILAAILLADFGVDTYQSMRLRERAARYAALQHVALNRLRGDVQSVTDLGDGRYELTTYLQNVGGEPIYVMTPQMRAYVQVASLWQEVPMTAAEESATGVTKIIGKQTYRYRFDVRVHDFAQLLPNYMHVRFSGAMLVSPSSTPNGDVFERKDNYYVYLKPFDVTDEVVLRRMRFSGKPPVWIPMPPH
jgi:ABC-type lipoprotein export system ATPase subunit